MTAADKRVGVIDVGSNSVRCAVFSNGELLARHLITSRLGEGVFNGFLSRAAIERTVDAVVQLVRFCNGHGAARPFIFATEAVRRAANAAQFTTAVRDAVGVQVDVVDGETEALLASLGALGDKNGCVIDVGGASTEIVVKTDRGVEYACSVGVGAVVLRDVCGVGRSKLTPYIAQKCRQFGKVPPSDAVVAVGGTATSLAACRLGLSRYDASLVHGASLSRAELFALADKLEGMSAEDVCARYPVDGRRAEILFGGALLLCGALDATGHTSLTVSESDNLEGYYSLLSKRGEI